jgi:hypothetical protein
MKKALLLFCILFSAHYVSAQWWCEINFNQNGTIYSTNSPTYYFDSLWQFGTTSKEAFQEDLPNVDGAYKLCTDTLNPISDTGRWEMYFGIDRDTLDFFNQCIEKVEFRAFQIRFKGIKDSTGLLVEISPDSIKWFNVLSDDEIINFHQYSGYKIQIDANIDSVGSIEGMPVWIPANDWEAHQYIYIDFEEVEDLINIRQLHFKLSYISKTFTPHAGVAFAYPSIFIPVYAEWINIEEQSNNNKVVLYPNPINENSKFILPDDISFPVKLTIVDLSGKVMHKSMEHKGYIKFPRINLENGVYFYNIKNTKGYITSGNILIN